MSKALWPTLGVQFISGHNVLNIFRALNTAWLIKYATGTFKNIYILSLNLKMASGKEYKGIYFPTHIKENQTQCLENLHIY